MKRAISILLFLIIVSKGNAQNAISESYQLVNDINKAENRKAIYMCSEINFTWKDYLKENPKATPKQKLDYIKTEAIIKNYVGGTKAAWLKNLPKLKTWQGNVAAKEFISYNAVDVDSFYQSHDLTGFYFYSEPLFNESKDKALIYIWYITGRLGISAHYYYCEKIDGVWRKVNRIPELGGFVS